MEALKAKLKRDKEAAYKRNIEKLEEKRKLKKVGKEKQEKLESGKNRNKEGGERSIVQNRVTRSNEINWKDVIEAGPSHGETIKVDENITSLDEFLLASEVADEITPKKTRLSGIKRKTESSKEYQNVDRTVDLKKSEMQTKPKRRKIPQKDKDPRAYKSMRELANARKRKFLDKMTAEQREIKRAKDREYYRKKKEEGKIIPIKFKPKRQQAKIRKSWKTASQRYRKRKSDLKHVLTPPESEDEARINHVQRNEPRNEQNETRRERGRKKVKRDRAKAYRDIKIIQEENRRLRVKVEKYKKRLQRGNKPKQGDIASPSPNTKVKHIIGRDNVSPNVRKKLLFSEVREATLKKNREALGNNMKAKQVFDKCLSGELITKYKVGKDAYKITPQKKNKLLAKKRNILDYERRPRNQLKVKGIKQKVEAYYLRDENSRMCPGKRDYVKQRGIKMQKKLLMESIKILYTKFLIQFPGTKLSLSTFHRYKPFWVVRPNMRDRETCLCEKHSNFYFLLNRLRIEKLTAINSTDDLIKSVCCSEDMGCMMGTCQQCTKKTLNIQFSSDHDKTITYYQWENVKEDRIVKGASKEVKMMKKVEYRCTLSNLILVTENAIPAFLQHIFKMRHQHKSIEDKKNTLQKNEILLQMDFSQNYVGKLSEEIQSMHFGASKKQISIQTGVFYYYNNNPEGKGPSVTSFATVSDNLDHQAHAVWIHLKPILAIIAENHPEADTLHFLSDGPTGQYRNRYNLYLCLKFISELLPKVNSVTYNWSEAGHGKGPMDGVGGYLKRFADLHVLKKNDVSTAFDFVNVFKNITKVKVIHIEAEAISNNKALLSTAIIPEIKGITDLQQVTWVKGENEWILRLRKFMCFKCSFGSNCKEYCAGEVDFSPAFNNTNTKPKTTGPRLKKKSSTLVTEEASPVQSQIRTEENASFELGDWIAVLYDDNWFPGYIKEIDGDKIKCTFMNRNGKNSFHWPDPPDEQSLKTDGILTKIHQPPVPISSTKFSLSEDYNRIEKIKNCLLE